MKQPLNDAPREFSITPEALAQGQGTLVDRLFELVSCAAREGRIHESVKLPSIRDLAYTCGISRDTVAKAYDRLVAHGLIDSRRGAGFYGRPAARRSRERPAAAAPRQAFDSSVLSRLLPLVHPGADTHSRSGSGVLPADWMNDDGAIARALRNVARMNLRGLADNGSPLGYAPLRQQLQLKLQELGIEADEASLMLTNGATEAMHLVVQWGLRGAGSKVLVDDPGGPLLRQRLASTGLNILSVPRLSDGPDLDVLRRLCEEHRPSHFFCSSVLHSPTGGLLSSRRAYELLRLADEFNLTLVEDDSFGDLLTQPPPLPVSRLASLDQLRRVIYIGSFSKTLAPGLRCGFMAASPDRIQWLATYRLLGCLSSTSLAERVAYQMLSDGSYRHRCAQLRSRIDRARPALIEQLQAIGLQVPALPEAGMFVWARLPHGMDALALSTELRQKGHLLAPGTWFGDQQQFRNFLRFNVAEPVEAPLRAALEQAIGTAAQAAHRDGR